MERRSSLYFLPPSGTINTKAVKLAEKVGVKLHAHQRFSLRTVRQKLSEATAKKREAQKDDANNRVKWFEEIT